MKNDPLLIATHFERSFKFLMKHVILGKSMPLGYVQDYFSRLEFQTRGSPHIFMFLRVANVPYEIIESTAPAIEYMNKTIISQIPDPSADFETHASVTRFATRSSYCTRSSRTSFRIGFPKQTCTATKFSYRLHVN
jgi:hypothetical protein